MFVHWLHSSGVSYCDNKERVFIFDYHTKEKEHQNTTPPRTNQIASCFDALSITYLYKISSDEKKEQ
jgi:hypothetical protein